MESKTGYFTILYARGDNPVTLEKSGLTLGRLASCDVILNQSSVSRIHAGINYLDDRYYLTNLTSSNVLTLNGRRLAPQNSDVLADGDIIQIGPYLIDVALDEKHLRLSVRQQMRGEYRLSAPKPATGDAKGTPNQGDVLKVFWEKRTRDREDAGTRLRPVGKPEPGKAVIKWKPTDDLRPAWRKGLFIWVCLAFALFAAVAFWRYPQAFASRPLANPHIRKIDASPIARQGNENSCTTCHMASEPVETACITCHQAEKFHASNTIAHEAAGITCTACHQEHRGEDFAMRDAALESCARCHNDGNNSLYNGKSVRTAHGGTFGYPIENGKWIWKGLETEIAETIPAVVSAAGVGNESSQALISRQFHAVHVGRLDAPAGMVGDSRGRVSCSTCHKGFDPVDRTTPRETCASCHNFQRNESPAESAVNCVSCHVQHPFNDRRWDAFLTPAAHSARSAAIDAQIKRLGEK